MSVGANSWSGISESEKPSRARKAPNDDSDDAENARLNLALGNVLDMLNHACPF